MVSVVRSCSPSVATNTLLQPEIIFRLVYGVEVWGEMGACRADWHSGEPGGVNSPRDGTVNKSKLILRKSRYRSSSVVRQLDSRLESLRALP